MIGRGEGDVFRARETDEEMHFRGAGCPCSLTPSFTLGGVYICLCLKAEKMGMCEMKHFSVPLFKFVQMANKAVLNFRFF